MKNGLSNYFKSYRLKHGLSQRQLASIFGYNSCAYLSKIENGNALPGIKVLMLYTTLFNVSVEELMPELAKESNKLLKERINQNYSHFLHCPTKRKIIENLCGNPQSNMNYEPIGNESKILSIYPTKRGFAYSYFDNKVNLAEWANVLVGDEKYNNKLKNLILNFKPEAVLVFKHSVDNYKRSQTVTKNFEHTIRCLKEKQVPFKEVRDIQIRGVFDTLGAFSRKEVMQYIGEYFPELLSQRPHLSKIGKEHRSREWVFLSVAAFIAYQHAK